MHLPSPIQTAFLIAVVVAFAAFALTLMGAAIYVALGERPSPEPRRETIPAKRVSAPAP